MADASGSQLVDLLPGIDKKRRQGQSKARKSSTKLPPSTKETNTVRKRDEERFQPSSCGCYSTISSFTRNKLRCLTLTITHELAHLVSSFFLVPFCPQ